MGQTISLIGIRLFSKIAVHQERRQCLRSGFDGLPEDSASANPRSFRGGTRQCFYDSATTLHSSYETVFMGFFSNESASVATLDPVISEMDEYKAQVMAIDRSMAVIEFDPKGTVLAANANFLNALQYSLGDIKNQHHRKFVFPEEASSAEYRIFWDELRQGVFHSGEFRRLRKDGSEIWIQASYNPILDANGRTRKVIKFASDVTEQVRLRHNAIEMQKSLSEGVDQMTSTISEISINVQETAQLATRTQTETDSTTEAVEKLETSSRSIDEVIDLIRKLAEQTNLLALNATIEAARAGDAGKGFAVVASEVKELAQRTGLATKEIEDSIGVIRSSINDAVSSTGRVAGSIGDVNERMMIIASAVEEQKVTMDTLLSTTVMTD